MCLAGDSEGLEAWRQLTETRFAGQQVSILSFSLQGDTAERITVCEREIATFERDSGKVFDNEIKVGTFLLRLPNHSRKHILPMRVDTFKKWTDFRGGVAAISREISSAQTQPIRWTLEPWERERLAKVARSERWWQKMSKMWNTDHTSANCPHSNKTCQKLWKSKAKGGGEKGRQGF